MVSNLPVFQFSHTDYALDTQFQEQLEDANPEWLMKAMLATLPDVVLILNKERRVVFANGRSGAMFGLASLDQVLGKRIGDLLQCSHTNEGPSGCGSTHFCRGCGAMRAVIGALNGRAMVQDYAVSDDSSRAFDLRVWTSPVSIGGQRFCAFAAKDIGDEKRRHILERVFFNDLIKTAEAVTAYAEMIDLNAESTADLSGPLTAAAQQLVSQIDFQRLFLAAERGELQLAVQPIDVNEFVAEIASRCACSSLAEDRHIRVVTPALSACMNTDLALLEFVVESMLKNALEASEPGAYVQLKCSVAGDTVTFAVHNDAFMPRAVQIQVFKRSFSTKGEGHGLGTYAMKLLSEKYLEGQIQFETSETDGTTFYATYPLDLPS